MRTKARRPSNKVKFTETNEGFLTGSEVSQWTHTNNEKHASAKQEMAKLVAEQAAESARSPKQVVLTTTSQTSATDNLLADRAEQQTVLSVFQSVLNMQNHGCRSGSQQLMAAGESEDDVTHVNHIMALTVQKLETEATFVPVPEEKSLPQERMDVSSEVGDPGTKSQDSTTCPLNAKRTSK